MAWGLMRWIQDLGLVGLRIRLLYCSMHNRRQVIGILLRAVKMRYLTVLNTIRFVVEGGGEGVQLITLTLTVGFEHLQQITATGLGFTTASQISRIMALFNE